MQTFHYETLLSAKPAQNYSNAGMYSIMYKQLHIMLYVQYENVKAVKVVVTYISRQPTQTNYVEHIQPVRYSVM